MGWIHRDGQVKTFRTGDNGYATLMYGALIFRDVGRSLPCPEREGLDRITKGQKQIRLEIFSLFLVKPSLLGKVRSLSFICSCADEVKLISKWMSCISTDEVRL